MNSATSTLRLAAELDQAQLSLPPQSVESEACLLGAILMDNSVLDNAADIVSASDFYRHDHKVAFGAITSLVNKLMPADVITVYEHLQTKGQGDEIGGLPFLNQLTQFPYSRNSTRRYAEIIHEKAILRRLAAVGSSITDSVLNAGSASLQDLISAAENQVLAIGQSSTERREIKTNEYQKERFINQLQIRMESDEEVVGVKSGFLAMDHLTYGFQDGDLVILAGRPSMGKTALAINIAEHAAFTQQLPVLVVSLEMNADQLTSRMAGSLARVDQTKIKTGRLNDDELSRLLEGLEQMNGTLETLDIGAETVPSIRAYARRFAKRNGKIGLIVIDYLQLLASDKNENKNSEIGDITRGLKLLAKEMNCPVLVLSQLNRKVEERADKRPMMSDLRDSGSIEQDADLIMLIYRDEYYTKEASRDPGVAEVNIAKSRNGETGTLRLGWLPQYTKFTNL